MITPQQEKKLAIADSVINTASVIINHAKQLPVKNKYFFKRSYIRGLSRQNKKKRAAALFGMTFGAMVGAAEIARIASTPIPKFQRGTS